MDIKHDDEMIAFILLPSIVNLFSPIVRVLHLCSKPIILQLKTRCFMKKEATDTLTLRLPVSKKLRLEIIAHKDGRTLNSLCNKIIMDYIEMYDAKK